MFWISLAFKNLFRHRRRTLLIGMTMFLSTLTIILINSWERGMTQQMRKSLVLGSYGHIQVFSQGYSICKGEGSDNTWLQRPKLSKDLLLNSPEKVVQLFKSNSLVNDIHKRITTKGMIGIKHEKRMISLVGIEPENETILLSTLKCDMERIQDGDIFLSKDVVRDLDLKIGQIINVLFQNIYGESFLVKFTIKGIFKNTAPWFSLTSYVKLRYLQRLLKVQEEAVSEIVVGIKDERKISEFQDFALKEFFNRKIYNSVLNWKESSTQFFDIINGITTMFYFMYIIIFIITAFGIMSSVLITINERVKEMGTLKAMGMNMFQLGTLLTLEVCILSILCAIIASACVFPLSFYISSLGISAGNGGIAIFLFGGEKLRLICNQESLMIGIVWVIFISLLSTAYPLFKAGSKNTIELLRGNL